MAHLNDANSSCCSTPTSCDFDPYVNQASVPEYVNVGGQQEYMGGPRASLRSQASFQSTSSGTSYEDRTQYYDQPVLSQRYWPMNGRYGQSTNSGMLTRESSLTSTATSEESAVDPAPTRYPLNRWGSYGHGPPTNSVFWNVQAPYQPGTGTSQSGMTPAYTYSQYRLPRVPSNQYANAGVRPPVSNLAHPFNPYVMPPKNPPGGTSEATANAEQNPTVTQEEVTIHHPPSAGNLRRWRIRYGRDIEKLCAWAKERKGTKKCPSHLRALQTALEAIQVTRPAVYPLHKLKKGSLHGRAPKVRSKAATSEARRREGIRALNEELSKYYELPDDRTEWECPELLMKVLRDIETLEGPAQSE